MAILKNTRIRHFLWTSLGKVSSKTVTGLADLQTLTLQDVNDPRTGFPVAKNELVRDRTGHITHKDFQDQPGYKQKEQAGEYITPLQSGWLQAIIKNTKR